MAHVRKYSSLSWLPLCVLAVCSGCGTTRSTDTTRTATEQLLISDAIDRAVQSMNLQTLAGQTVYLDDSKLSDTVDKNYYISTLRQQLLASGCELRDKRDEAEFVVEARAGAIGTDRNDLLFGLPSMNVPQIPLVQPVPAAIPEIPIAKRKDQRGVAKIAVFAYHRATGTPVWQSGIVRQESSANDVWIFGAGPFQRGTIHDRTAFAGKTLGSENPLNEPVIRRTPAVSVTQESTFTPPQLLAKRNQPQSINQKVELVAHEETANPINVPATVTATGDLPPTNQAVHTNDEKVSGLAAKSHGDTRLLQSAGAPSANASQVASNTPGIAPDASSPPPAPSAYVKTVEASALPQPRFNSPE
jgi:hypothetical protein